jgi:serine/threonine-protein kinase HipA
MSMISRLSSLIQTVIVVPKAFSDPRSITSLNVVVNDVQVGTIVRTPGDFNAFSFEDSYRATGGVPVLSLSFRAAGGGLRKDPKPVARALPAFFANLLPEEKLREAMEKHHAGECSRRERFRPACCTRFRFAGCSPRRAERRNCGASRRCAYPKTQSRFSLAGVQMKLSVIKNTGRGRPDIATW